MTFNDSLKEFTTRRAALMQAGEELRRFLEESGMPDKARELPPKPYFCWAFLPSLGQVVTDLDSFRDELTINFGVQKWYSLQKAQESRRSPGRQSFGSRSEPRDRSKGNSPLISPDPRGCRGGWGCSGENFSPLPDSLNR